MKKLFYLIFVLLISLFGCEKILDVETPPNLLAPNLVFADSANLKSAVYGMYAKLNSSQSYTYQFSVLNSLYADETSSTSFPTFLTNSLDIADSQVAGIWSEWYSNIYAANSIIEGVEASTSLAATTKQQAKGEAYFVRALCHYNLINTFGSIPVITSTARVENQQKPQASSDAVYQQIMADLKQSIAMLPASYAVSGNERTRANQLVAKSLLAKVYLYTNDWANAETESYAIISNPLFSLSSDLSRTFLSTSTEAIFQLDAKATGYVPLTSFFVPSAGVRPSYTLTPELSNAFEKTPANTDDLRKINWVGMSAGFGYPAKYKITRSGTGVFEYNTIIRLAEIRLVHAEACARQNKIALAQDDINAIRGRAGLANTTADSEASLLLAIEQERRVELFCENGIRFFDLKRMGRLDAVLTPVKVGWKSTAANYPIPAQEIANNSSLVQHQGY